MAKPTFKFSVTGRLLFPHTIEPDNAGAFKTDQYKIQALLSEADTVIFLRLIEEAKAALLAGITDFTCLHYEKRKNAPQFGRVFRCETKEAFEVVDEHAQPLTTEIV